MEKQKPYNKLLDLILWRLNQLNLLNIRNFNAFIPSSVMYLVNSSAVKKPLPSVSKTWKAFRIWSSGEGLYLENV